MFRVLTKMDWALAARLESIVHKLAAFSLGDVQKQAVSASYAMLLLKKATAVVRSTRIACYVRGRPGTSTTAKTWPQDYISVEAMCPPAQRCLQRLTRQIENRMPNPTANQYKAMLLDPRVKDAITQFNVEDRIAAEDQLKAEHRMVYAAMHAAKATSVPQDDSVGTA